mmetsp:Transcript_39701/g.85876  ORF Transcript_39701/g.85876 Transcript_39701/m.85876 type:complete len:252 (+) Transcript_39701:365-1120(+)
MEDFLQTLRRLLQETPHSVLLGSALASELRVEIGDHIVHHGAALHLHSGLKGQQTFLHALHQLGEGSGIEFHHLGHMATRGKLHEVIVGFQSLQIRIELLQWNGQAHAKGQRHGVGEGVVAIELKDAEVGVVPVERMREHVEADPNAFVLLHIDVTELRALQDSGTIGHQNGGGFSEKKNAVGRGLVEGDSLSLVVDEFSHELQQRRCHLWIIPPGIQRSREEIHSIDRGVLGVVHQPIKEHRVWLAAGTG